MAKTTTQKSETTTLTLDEALGKIDAMLAPEPATVETEKSFSTRADFDAYVLEEIAKAEAETVVEARTERLTALKAAIEIAKVASWEQSSTTTIKLFVDKWQVKRPATSTEVSATVNKAADAVETAVVKSSTEAPAPVETPTVETPAVEAPVVKSAVEKAGDAEPTVKRVGQYEDGEGWPIDMNG